MILCGVMSSIMPISIFSSFYLAGRIAGSVLSQSVCCLHVLSGLLLCNITITVGVYVIQCRVVSTMINLPSLESFIV